jgi:hypothetical protein
VRKTDDFELLSAVVVTARLADGETPYNAEQIENRKPRGWIRTASAHALLAGTTLTSTKKYLAFVESVESGQCTSYTVDLKSNPSVQ